MQDIEANIINKTVKNFIRFAGLSRSGNHPFLNWLLYKYTGRICFLNHRILGVPAHVIARMENPVNNGNLPCFDKPERSRVSISDFWDLLVISYENETLERLFNLDNKSINIFILRDPFNYFASRLKHRDIGRWPLKQAISLWKSYAREAVQGLDNGIFVNFNKWAIDKEYRQELCAQIGVEFNDLGIDEVPANGGGSSFEKMKHQNRGSNMRIFERWREFIKDDGYQGKRLERYKTIFRDQEIIELSDKLFGQIAELPLIIGA